MDVCQTCGRDYIYEKRRGGTKKDCNNCVSKRRRNTLRSRAIAYKGGECLVCGYNKSIRALCFHHRENKLFTVSSSFCRSWDSIKKEIDKCDLLCANCHMELHFLEQNGAVA